MEKQNGKLKLLHLLRILAAQSDKDHPVSINSIINELSQLGISAERKSLYNDLSALKDFGFEIKAVRSKDVGYYLEDYPLKFEEAEALWDMLHAQKLYDDDVVNKLKRKLESMISLHEKKKIRTRIYTTQKPAHNSDQYKRSLDIIHEAIKQKKKITFIYSDPVLIEEIRKKKKTFTVSPYVLSSKDGKFFLIAGSEEDEGLSNFYLDKIEGVQMTKQFATDVRELAGDLDFDLNCYSKGLFEEYSKETETIILNCDKSILTSVTAKFDVKDIKYTEEDERYDVTIETELSEDLLAWIFINHSAVKIIEPKKLTEAMANTAKSIYITYI